MNKLQNRNYERRVEHHRTMKEGRFVVFFLEGSFFYYEPKLRIYFSCVFSCINVVDDRGGNIQSKMACLLIHHGNISDVWLINSCTVIHWWPLMDQMVNQNSSMMTIIHYLSVNLFFVLTHCHISHLSTCQRSIN